MSGNPRFNGKVDPRMNLAASIIAEGINERTQAQLDKLKMADIFIDDWEVLHEFANGCKIMAFGSDGLVDEEEDWSMYFDFEFGEYIEKTYRFYQPKTESNRQPTELFYKNFQVCAKRPYGLFEMIRNTLYYDRAYLTPSVSSLTSVYNRAFEYNPLFISEDGTIVLDESDKKESINSEDCYYDTIKRIRQKIIDHVIKHGPEETLIGNKCFSSYSSEDYSFKERVQFACITCLNSANNRYQLMRMGEGEITSFVLFDLETKKCIASGNCVTEIRSGKLLGLPVQDGIICLNMKSSKLYKLEFDVSGLGYIRRYNVTFKEFKELRRKKQELIEEIKDIM